MNRESAQCRDGPGGLALAVFIAAIIKRFLIAGPGPSRIVGVPEGNTNYDPAVWGKYYPQEYNSYLKNYEMAPSPTGFGGNQKIQKSVKEPELLINFKGMPFSVDYTYRRGHPYALKDLKESKRVGPKTAGGCMTCKTANLIDIYRDMGDSYAKTPLADLLPRMKHPNRLRKLP